MNKMSQVIMVERLRNNTKRERKKGERLVIVKTKNDKLHSVLDTTHYVSFPFKFDIGSLA